MSPTKDEYESLKSRFATKKKLLEEVMDEGAQHLMQSWRWRTSCMDIIVLLKEALLEMQSSKAGISKEFTQRVRKVISETAGNHEEAASWMFEEIRKICDAEDDPKG